LSDAALGTFHGVGFLGNAQGAEQKMAGMTNIMRGLWRTLIVTHRYLGVAVSVPMVMWFASGFVMMYAGFPHIVEDQRIRALPPIPWAACCRSGERLIADDEPLSRIQIESLAGTPMIRLRRVGQPEMIADLQRGATIRVDAARAEAIARDAAARIIGPGASLVSAEQVHTDQWTIGRLDRDPLFRFALDDPEQTNIYVSSTTGQVFLWTTKTQRFWTWLGAIPHWLYFVDLRRNPAVWSKILIWTSTLGTFLTLTGLCVGIAHFKCRTGKAGSPYGGALFWHHMAGLMFGLVTLTWVLSGLISMNPWGFLESDRSDEAQARVEGQPVKWGEVHASLAALRTRPDVVDAVSLTAMPLKDRLYWRVAQRDGKIIRLDATGNAAPVSEADLASAAQRIAATVGIAEQGMLYEEDAYYFRRRDAVVLPVYRVILNDEGSTRYYLDPITGSLMQRVDSNDRWHRWLFGGLHRIDFMPWMRARPVWDIIVLIMMLGGFALTTIGLYLAVGRVHSDAVRVLCLTKWRAPHTAPSKGDSIDD
jgi:hypothetical protein